MRNVVCRAKLRGVAVGAGRTCALEGFRGLQRRRRAVGACVRLQSERGGGDILCHLDAKERTSLVSAVSGCQDACCDIRYWVVCSSLQGLKDRYQRGSSLRTMLHIPKSTDKLLIIPS